MRVKPKEVITRNSPNQSRRDYPGKPYLIVIHSTESSNMEGTVNWLCTPGVPASCHVVTSYENGGSSARLVPNRMKAWHSYKYNSVSLGLEQVGYASLKRWQWIKRMTLLNETARWIAAWSELHGIPIRHVKPSAPGHINPGVTLHSDLGDWGGGHVDPGKGYPTNKVLKKARKYRRKRYGH